MQRINNSWDMFVRIVSGENCFDQINVWYDIYVTQSYL